MKMPEIDKLDRIIEQKLTDPIQVKHLMLLLKGRMKQSRSRGRRKDMLPKESAHLKRQGFKERTKGRESLNERYQQSSQKRNMKLKGEDSRGVEALL